MSAWIIEMRVRVEVDAGSRRELEDMERRLAERVRDVDDHPRFVTAEPWVFSDRDKGPGSFVNAPSVPNGNVSVARGRRRRLGPGPS